ncbi:hypothetical protein [Bacteroides sp. 51]|uniref:hypothetical protein n=1 Tax=Bacteroides sp. 51 TaxID=2302938 RepID=UPI0013D699A8|nr:hypothetical protein [Bacteroides sp. 51]
MSKKIKRNEQNNELSSRITNILKFLSAKEWGGIAAIVAILALVATIYYNEAPPKKLETLQIAIADSITDSSYLKEDACFYGKGTAIKGDSIKAWSIAHERAQNNLAESLSSEEIIKAKKYAKIDYAKSSMPFLMSDGWKAEVVIFVTNNDLE